MVVGSSMDATYAVTGQPNSAAIVETIASNAAPQIRLYTFYNGGLYNGEILVGGILDFLGTTSGTAGALGGYINVKVNGVNAKIPVYAP
jgi:hypothetical protein